MQKLTELSASWRARANNYRTLADPEINYDTAGVTDLLADELDAWIEEFYIEMLKELVGLAMRNITKLPPKMVRALTDPELKELVQECVAWASQMNLDALVAVVGNEPRRQASGGSDG